VGNIENKRSTTNTIQRWIRHTILEKTTGAFPFRGMDRTPRDIKTLLSEQTGVLVVYSTLTLSRQTWER